MRKYGESEAQAGKYGAHHTGFANDVITGGGAFASSGAPAHAKKQNIVENVSKLAGAMRKTGSIVIPAHYIVKP